MKLRVSRLVQVIGCCGLLTAGWFVGQSTPDADAQLRDNTAPQPSAEAEPPAKPAAKAQGAKPAPAILDPHDDRNIVAYVNGEPITRQELAEQLIARRGKDQLKLLINRKIIEQACAKAGITITDHEVNEDLLNMARQFGSPTLAEFEKSVLRERKITLLEYTEDVIRPALMIKKLAGREAVPTEEELQKAYQANYGKKIEARMILEQDKTRAARLFEAVYGKPEQEFIRVAKEQKNQLGPTGGLVTVNRHSSLGRVEEAAFGMKDGEVSEIIQTNEGYVILYRVKEIKPQTDVKFEDVRDRLYKDIHEKKAQIKTPELFRKLASEAQVRDYLNYESNFRDVMTREHEKKNPTKPVPPPEPIPVPLPE